MRGAVRLLQCCRSNSVTRPAPSAQRILHYLFWQKGSLRFLYYVHLFLPRLRIYQYYLPVFFWCERQLKAHKASGAPGPLVIGISAPQGCGKSTVCEQLEVLLTSTGSTAVSVSIDDFYLTNTDQRALASTHRSNPLLQQRGNAGSHDLTLGSSTLSALSAGTSTVQIPRYDKSAFEGQGDRALSFTWPEVRPPVDVVLFEGWMLGFRPVGSQAAAAVDPNLAAVDQFLQKYEEAWDSFVGAWLVVKVADPSYAFKWRLQAEQAMRAKGKPAMTDEQVSQFVSRYMPAYKCYLPGLYGKGPTTARPGKLLVIEVDESRSPVAVQPAPIM